MIQTLTATRYVTPLREGGSLPAIVDTPDGPFVLKFVGAGQGNKALIAELIAGEIARTLGLNVPEIAFIELDAAIGRAERDPEIQDLLQASVGLNLGLRYLPESLMFNPLLKPPPEATLASNIVWFDAYVTNVDRTPRNVNLLIWQDDLWLIDHGASLYFHHSWEDYLERSRSKFPLIKDHALLPFASELDFVSPINRERLTPERIREIVSLVPDVWLDEDRFETPEAHRAAYVEYLLTRLAAADSFVEEAQRVRATRV